MRVERAWRNGGSTPRTRGRRAWPRGEHVPGTKAKTRGNANECRRSAAAPAGAHGPRVSRHAPRIATAVREASWLHALLVATGVVPGPHAVVGVGSSVKRAECRRTSSRSRRACHVPVMRTFTAQMVGSEQRDRTGESGCATRTGCGEEGVSGGSLRLPPRGKDAVASRTGRERSCIRREQAGCQARR